MPEIKKNETRTVSHKKVENGYIITLRTEKQNSKGWDSTEKQYISKDAIETTKLLKDLIK